MGNVIPFSELNLDASVTTIFVLMDIIEFFVNYLFTQLIKKKTLKRLFVSMGIYLLECVGEIWSRLQC